MQRIVPWIFLWLAAACPVAAQSPPADADAGIAVGPEVFGDLRARDIGPAVMSGRIAALDAAAADPRLIYVGAAGGGLWKSRDGGVTFKSVFDDHNQCIGAVTIDQARPDTVWVGTGEVWVRNSVSVGDGIYRTVDGGETWLRLGLERTERIGEILLDPRDPQVVWAAALGHLWDANEERGLYRTADGGATWERVLFVDENTGCSDIALDPSDPDVIYAAMWDFRRSPDFFRSGGPGSGLYRSRDGGRSWTRLTRGLPAGELGRIALAVAPAQPRTLYATVESAATALYRSDDGGDTWREINTQEVVKGRPFYFSLLIPDPADPERLYKTSNDLLVSRDGGRTFSGLGGWVHVDQHALWINPRDPNHMITGNDGGVYITRNRGSGWRHVSNLPVAQFYHVAVDDRRPFNVFGGLQDNGTWTAPSRAPGGIENSDWVNLGGGDGFAVAVDPDDPDLVYWEWQGGNLNRHDRRTGEDKDIQPLPAADEPEFRWNWNTPVVAARNPSRLYTGSQFLHVSRDRGESWRRLSPDLTTNDPAKLRQGESGGLSIDNTTAENHCTIFTISPSTVDRDVIWVGTDDGRLSVTEDGGGRFADRGRGMPDLPDGTWISCVEASPSDRKAAFVTCDGHRTGDRRPYVFATDDLGRTWRSLATDGITGHAHVIRQDPVNPDLLYLGTEDGLFITLDRGRHWARFAEEFPKVSVRDLVLQERESSLVIATHGRGILILDDVTPLREITREALGREVALLSSRPAVLRTPRGKQQSPGDTWFVAGNPGTAAEIRYFLQKRHLFGEMKVEIFAPDGELLKVLPGGKRKGLNRVQWSPRLKPPKVAPSPTLDPATSFAAAFGPAAPEGRYRWRLTRGKDVVEGTVDVAYDPDYPHAPADRRVQQQTVRELYDMLARLAYVCEAASDLRDQARTRAAAIPDGDLPAALGTFADELDAFHASLMVTEKVQGISGLKRLREKVVRLYAAIAGFGGRPTRSQLDRLAVFRDEIGMADGRFGEMTRRHLADLNGRLAGRGQAPLAVLTEAEFAARGD